MLGAGLVVAIGLVFLWTRLSWPMRTFVLSHPLAVDLLVFLGLNWLHSGSTEGVMTAAVGALTCSILLTLGRKCFGFKRAGVFVPGIFRPSL